MLRSLLHAGVCVFVGLVLSLALAAQENGLTRGLFLGGTVCDDETQQSISSVTLVLQRDSGDTASATVVSGTEGEFQFNGVVSGSYHLLAQAKGYDPVSVPVMLAGTPKFNFIVELRRTQTGPAQPSTDPVTIHQLQIPDRARDAFNKGMRLLIGAKPDYQRALLCFERAVKQYPDYYEAYAEMGVVYEHLGDEAAAEKALRDSAQMSSGGYADALLWLAELLNDAGRFADSVVWARQCVAQNQLSSTCSLELARALAGLKQLAEAESVAIKASELNPNNPKSFLVLGNIHIQERKYESVVKDFDTYLRLDPSSPLSSQVRASAEQARRALANVQAANPPLPEVAR